MVSKQDEVPLAGTLTGEVVVCWGVVQENHLVNGSCLRDVSKGEKEA